MHTPSLNAFFRQAAIRRSVICKMALQLTSYALIRSYNEKCLYEFVKRWVKFLRQQMAALSCYRRYASWRFGSIDQVSCVGRIATPIIAWTFSCCYGSYFHSESFVLQFLSEYWGIYCNCNQRIVRYLWRFGVDSLSNWSVLIYICSHLLEGCTLVLSINSIELCTRSL